MPRKLKVYQTSIGFFDLALAVPSMKAALETWGADSNLFHQGFASEVTDPETVATALDHPGVVLKRPVGTSEPFAVESRLPKSVMARGTAKPHAIARKTSKRRSTTKDDAKARKASAAYERERKKREATERREEARRVKECERRDTAVRKATDALDDAREKYEDTARQIKEERAALDQREADNDANWEKTRHRLDDAVRKARG